MAQAGRFNEQYVTFVLIRIIPQLRQIGNQEMIWTDIAANAGYGRNAQPAVNVLIP